MRRWMRVAAMTAGGVAGGVAAAAGVGTLAWNRATARVTDRMAADAREEEAKPFSVDELEGLPAPVARYFRFALKPGQARIRSARLRQRGEFRSGGAGGAWSPFTAAEHFSAGPAGFVWDARIRMAPLMAVRVRDSYVGGAGSMRAKVAALLPVVDQAGSPELASGALMRWLAEAVWLPTALLPGAGVRWEAVDDSTARATVEDAGNRVSLDFHFAPDGRVVRVYSPARFRDVNGTGVPTPWEGTFRDYGEVEGMKVPLEGEVGWILPEGKVTYWRGRNVSIEYDFAR